MPVFNSHVELGTCLVEAESYWKDVYNTHQPANKIFKNLKNYEKHSLNACFNSHGGLGTCLVEAESYWKDVYICDPIQQKGHDVGF